MNPSSTSVEGGRGYGCSPRESGPAQDPEPAKACDRGFSLVERDSSIISAFISVRCVSCFVDRIAQQGLRSRVALAGSLWIWRDLPSPASEVESQKLVGLGRVTWCVLSSADCTPRGAASPPTLPGSKARCSQMALALDAPAVPQVSGLSLVSQHRPSSCTASRLRHAFTPCKRVCRREQTLQRPVVCLGLKAKETFDASFSLDKAAEDRLHNLLQSDAFSKQASC